MKHLKLFFILILLLIFTIPNLNSSSKILYSNENNIPSKNGIMIPINLNFVFSQVRAIKVSEDKIYFGTWGEGIYISKDYGDTLIPINNGLITHFIYNIEIPQNNNKILYLGSDIGIYKSIDGGKNWSLIGNLDNDIFSLTIDPIDSNKLIAGVYEHGLNISYDGGNSWSYIDIDLNLKTEFEDIFSIEINPHNPNEIYIGTYYGIYKSFDSGLNWTRVGLNECKVNTIKIDPNNSQIIYAGTNYGVFKSIDGSLTWQNIFKTLKSEILTIAIDTNDPKIIYIGSDKGEVYKSIDFGKNWSKLNISSKKILTIEIDKNSTILIGKDRGFSLSYNSGKSFITIEDPKNVLTVTTLDINENVIFAGTFNGLYLKYKDSLWKRIGFDNYYVYSIEIDKDNVNTIFIGTNYGLFKSDDFGKNFYAIDKGLNLNSIIYSIKINKIDNNKFLYLGTNNGFYISDYGDENKLEFKKKLNISVSNLKIDPIDSKTIYLGSIGIYKSIDAGLSWEIIGLESYPVYSIEINQKDNNKIYVGTAKFGIFKSNNGGKTWEKALDIDPDIYKFYTFTSIISNPDDINNIYAFGYGFIPGNGFPPIIFAICLFTNNDCKDWKEKNLPKTITKVNSAIFINETNEFIISTDLNVYIFNIYTDEGYWIINDIPPIDSGIRITSSILIKNKLYFGTINGYIGIYDLDEKKRNIISYYDLPINCIAPDLNNSNTIFFGSDYGIYRYDYLKNEIYEPLSGERNNVYTILLDNDNFDCLYIGTDNGVLISKDGGNKWEHIGLKNINVYSLAFEPSNKSILYAGTKNGLYKKNEKDKWILIKDFEGDIYSIDLINQDTIYVGTDLGVYKSKDKGITWESLDLEDSKIFSIIHDKEGNLYVCGYGGVYFYDINKKIWLSMTNGLTNHIVNTMVFDNNKNLYIGTYGSGIFKFNSDSILPEKPILKFNIVDIYPNLNWEKSKEGIYPIEGYAVFRGESVENMILIDKVDESVLNYIDKNVIPGLTYYYYVVSYDYMENYSEPSNVIKVKIPIKDENPPSIEIFYPQKGDYINKKSIKITGKVYDLESGIDKLYINEIEIAFLTTGEFEYDINLIEGINSISIKAIDKNGNLKENIIDLFCDMLPPEINIKIPEKVYTSTINLSGFLSDNSNKIKFLKINEKEISFTNNFNFSYSINLNEGINILTLELEDYAGNKTIKNYKVEYIKKIIMVLHIGSNIIYINDSPKEIDVPPKIIEGRTYLPIRWIAEPLGAEVEWNGNEKKVTVILKSTIIELWINKNVAKVNENYVFIDADNPNVVPLIIQGRTMLPIRFVAESLGCKVDWDNLTKKITITYPSE